MKHIFLITFWIFSIYNGYARTSRRSLLLSKNIDYCHLLKTAFCDTLAVKWFNSTMQDSILFIDLSHMNHDSSHIAKVNCDVVDIRKGVQAPILKAIPDCCINTPDSCLHYYRFFISKNENGVYIEIVKGVYRGGGKTFHGVFIYKGKKWLLKDIGWGDI